MAGCVGTAWGQQAIPNPVVGVRSGLFVPVPASAERCVLAVVLDIHPGFHINPPKHQLDDDSLIPTALRVIHRPVGLWIDPVRYPPPKAVTVGTDDQPRRVTAYEGRAVLYVPIAVVGDAKPGVKQVEFELIYQACDRTQCLPPVTVPLTVNLEVVGHAVRFDPSAQAEADIVLGFTATADSPSQPSVQFDAFGLRFSVVVASWWGFGVLLLVAAMGGLLLNFTPCVLPVIPLKIMGLSHAATSRGRCLALGLVMGVGVVVFWVALGAVIAGVSGFTATNQLFQYPAFTLGVGALIALMAVGMFGFAPVRLPGLIYRFDPKQGTLTGSFGLGVMTAVLSTPCTAPFMGAAAAWAATQHPATTLVSFAAIGSGMALPYLLLGAFPAWVSRMPRTGPASQLIKQVMGLLLLAVGAYFVGVGLAGVLVNPPDPPTLMYWWPVMGFIAAAGGWLAYRTMRITDSIPQRVLFVGVGLLVMAGSVYGGMRLTQTGPIQWVPYTPQRFTQALQDEQVVVMDFTAEWCLNCKWLEKNVLNQPRVAQRLNQAGVVAMQVDLTGRNEPGRRMLKKAGRLTIPLLIVFDANGQVVFQGDFYTAQQVLDAIEQAQAVSRHAVKQRNERSIDPGLRGLALRTPEQQHAHTVYQQQDAAWLRDDLNHRIPKFESWSD